MKSSVLRGVVVLTLLSAALPALAATRSLSTYRNTALGIRLSYPKGWDVQETFSADETQVTFSSFTPNEVLVNGESQHVVFLLGVTDANPLPAALPEILRQATYGMTLVTEGASRIGRSTGSFIIAQKKGRDGTQLTLKAAGAIVHERLYLLVLSLPSTSFDRYDPVFEKLLKSVVIRPPTPL